MRTTVSIVAAVFVAATLAVVGAEQSSPQVQFEKALALEEVQGKLAEAIAVYEKVVAESSDKALAARAQLRIGICYERLGVEKAREAFEKVIKNYPGEAEAVAQARAKLDSIRRTAAAEKTPELSVRNLPVDPTPPLELYRVSPDGRYVAYVDANTGDLGVRDISTGKLRRLTDEAKDYSQYAIGPEWSPDATKLVYAWNERELRVVALDGTAPRILLGDKKEGWVVPRDWSADGRLILVATHPYRQRTLRLDLVSAVDGTVRPLRTFEDLNVTPGECRFSPDGRFIAYSRPPRSSTRERDIFLLPVDGNQEIALLEHPADDGFLGWLPGGRGILFTSDRAGAVDLWTVPVNNGRATGAATLVKRGVGPITPMGLTKSDAFYYRTPAAFMDVYTVRLDPSSGNAVGTPMKEPLPFEGSNTMPAWSPDGRQLAYVSLRPGERRWVLCIYAIDTGKVREFRLGRRYGYPTWSPDGRYLYLQATVADGQGVERLDVQNGEIAPFIAAGMESEIHSVQTSPDRKWIVFGRDAKAVCQVVRRNAATGEETEIDRSAFGNLTAALSPDGSRLAMIMRSDAETRVLKIMEFPDGTPKEIARFAMSGSWIINLAWSSDGRYIYYSNRLTEKSGWRLLRISADGGVPHETGLTARYFRQLSMHPDGSRISYSTTPENREPAQVWVMENFLPAIKR